jgi:hypothetical protein
LGLSAYTARRRSEHDVFAILQPYVRKERTIYSRQFPGGPEHRVHGLLLKGIMVNSAEELLSDRLAAEGYKAVHRAHDSVYYANTSSTGGTKAIVINDGRSFQLDGIIIADTRRATRADLAIARIMKLGRDPLTNKEVSESTKTNFGE